MSKQTDQLEDLSLPLLTEDEALLDRIVRMAKALSDPIRVQMLHLLAGGRACCGLPPVSSMPVPGPGEPAGICVCEFQERYRLGQSKVSYHLRILKEAGLVTEEARGKWTFYSLNKEAAREVVELMRLQLKL